MNSSLLVELLSGIRVVKALGLEAAQADRFRELSKVSVQASLRALRAREQINPIIETFSMLGLGLLYHGVTGGAAALGNSVQGMLVGFAILIVFYILGGMGAGDVKLMAAIGAWLGMPLTLYVFFASAVAGGIDAVGLLLV